MSPKEHFVDYQGHRIHALLYESRDSTLPPVVVQPGILLATNYWSVLLPNLPLLQDRTVLHVSLPGHYPSTVPKNFSRQQMTPEFMAGALEASIAAVLGKQKVIVMGHSTGGFSALNIATCYPGRIAAVISIAGFGDGRWGGGEGLLQRLAAGNAIMRWLFRRIVGFMMRSFVFYYFSSMTLARKKFGYYRNKLNRQAMRATQSLFRRNNAFTLQETMAGVYGLRATASFGYIQAPVLLISGKYDPVISTAETNAVRKTISNITAHEFDCGHMIALEETDQFKQAVTTFIRQRGSMHDHGEHDATTIVRQPTRKL